MNIIYASSPCLTTSENYGLTLTFVVILRHEGFGEALLLGVRQSAKDRHLLHEVDVLEYDAFVSALDNFRV